MATVALSGIITPTNVVTATSTTTLSNKTLVAPALGTPASGVVTNLTGTASININGTVGATTPTTVVATTVKASTTMGVGGATPSASGSGITFPASQSASTDANTLDDYEEGTFTPRIDGLTTAGTGTYTTQTGRYVKIGKMVTLWFYIDWSNHTGTGSIQFANFPFTAQNSIAMPSSASISNIALSVNNYSSTAAVQPNETYAFPLQYPLSGGAAALIPMDTSANIYCTATYEVA